MWALPGHSWPMWAVLGPSLPKLRPTLAELGQTLAEMSPRWPNSGQSRPKVADAGRSSAKSDRNVASVGQHRPMLPTSANIGQFGTQFEQHVPEFGQIWKTTSGQHRQHFGTHRPSLDENPSLWVNVGQPRPKFAPSRPMLVDSGPNLGSRGVCSATCRSAGARKNEIRCRPNFAYTG